MLLSIRVKFTQDEYLIEWIPEEEVIKISDNKDHHIKLKRRDWELGLIQEDKGPPTPTQMRMGGIAITMSDSLPFKGLVGIFFNIIDAYRARGEE